MPKRLKIPQRVKKIARKGLEERQVNQAGLTRKEAKKQGVKSGVETAEKLVRNRYLEEEDAKRIDRFYNRFKNCKTKGCETALKLWGGREWGKLMNKIFY